MPRLAGTLVASVLIGCATTAGISAAADRYVYTVAGPGKARHLGDGGPATLARPHAGCVAALADGGFLIAGPGRIREVAASGRISTVAGTGRSGYSGDGGPATAAKVAGCGLSALPGGGFLLADGRNHRVRRVAPDGTISTIAGNGSSGDGGDGGPAISAALTNVTSVSAFPEGGFLISTHGRSDLIRRVDAEGRIATVAGLLSHRCRDVDGRPVATLLLDPQALAALPDGQLLVADKAGCVLRVAADGTVVDVAGSGSTTPYGGDGGPARDASMVPTAVAPTADGGFLVVDYGIVRKVDATGVIQRIAGCLTNCASGDGPALGIRIQARAVAAAADGTIYVAEGTRIDRIDAAGSLTTFATPGGDSLALAGDGSLLVTGGGLVRRIAPDGSSTTVAGGGTKDPAAGDVATNVRLPSSMSVNAMPDGGFMLGTGFQLFRVSGDGTIAPVAGTESNASEAPTAIADLPDGTLVYIRENFLRGQLAELPPGPGAATVESGPLPITVGRPAALLDARGASVAALPGGGFAISWTDQYRDSTLAIVGTDGSVAQSVTQPHVELEGLAADARGEVYFAASDCAHGCGEDVGRLSPSGQLEMLSRPGDAGFFGDSDGDPASRLDLFDDITDIVPTPDGGILVAANGPVLWIAPTHTQRLALAITRQSLPLLDHRQIAVRTTVPASLSIVARRGRRIAGRAHAHVRRGLTHVSLPSSLPGGEYQVTVTGRSADRQVATSQHRLLIGGVLPMSTARGLAAIDNDEVRACRRFGPARVDCLTSDSNCGSNFCDDSCGVMALDLRRDGIVWLRPYGFLGTTCPKGPAGVPRFRRSPKWDARATQASPL